MASSQIFLLRDDALGAGLNLGGGTWIFASTDYYIGGESIFVSSSKSFISTYTMFSLDSRLQLMIPWDQ